VHRSVRGELVLPGSPPDVNKIPVAPECGNKYRDTPNRSRWAEGEPAFRPLCVMRTGQGRILIYLTNDRELLASRLG
jgi:hypothetical protein